MTDPTSPRSPLEQDDLQAAVGPDWVVDLRAEATSTNAVAAAAPARNLVVVAEHQSAGRGRLDRRWETPAGAALTFSAVVDPGVEPARWPLLPLAAGLAVAAAIDGAIDGASDGGEVVPATLKWPNDVLLAGEKVCGILVERLGTRPPYAVIGIGLNVSQTRAELPVPTATSLALAGRVVDRATLLSAVLRELRERLVALRRSPPGVMAEYRDRSATMGQRVRVELPDGVALIGTAVDVDSHGQLAVETATGRRVVGAGDVVHVRPAEEAGG